MQPEDYRGLTPLFYSHVNPYGRLFLNMLERIIIEKNLRGGWSQQRCNWAVDGKSVRTV
jgi:hypothetical protein